MFFKDATEINLDDEIYVLCLIGLLSDGGRLLLFLFLLYSKQCSHFENSKRKHVDEKNNKNDWDVIA